MKDLKFRAWHKEYDKYVDYLTGFDFENKEITWEERTVTYEYTETDKEHWTNFDDVIIEQYTGSEDKNGKEIYVGDIIKAPGETFELKSIGEMEFLTGCVGLEVIGNLHENKDLLK